MKNTDFETLKARREKVLAIRKQTEEEQDAHIGLIYTQVVEGRVYPVMASFSVGKNTDEADDKIKYLISGQKS